ncbi:GntR family transcriptional regulator [Sediminibacillus massiliensis]|uniref:GntR family transcriptional regulator n=1 Tax=Sediminibacillus massiliensis TaxID=1926277 RepID=UPI0009886583|nr:GntR family transcriptional regulator [Sediminibacillus massiliensis]
MEILPLEKTNYSGSTRDYIYNVIKRKIINLELKPGTKISEKQISEVLEVSRTPIREAFLQLSQEDLIQVYPQSGTIVSLIDLAQVEEARFVRESLEVGIVGLACEKMSIDSLIHLEANVAMQEKCDKSSNQQKLLELDDEFHRLLFEGTDKLKTWKMIQQMNAHFNRLRLLRLSSVLNWDIIISQHKEIFSLITNKNLEQAQFIIQEHLRLAVIEKSLLKKQYPDYFK